MASSMDPTQPLDKHLLALSLVVMSRRRHRTVAMGTIGDKFSFVCFTECKSPTPSSPLEYITYLSRRFLIKSKIPEETRDCIQSV